ncbi:hypothetical protein PN417_08280 [Halorubrum ezzemoulense]|uniref:hypothetical protein n=1 Tax=Halorubrum ezzemoulense TaxID=337243 RepID=UPI00232B2304|nr:hypothetical protein [Halorubrum ezzemoulense]MDB9300928.1 hypothetical protein [Halorubrum ezzemoulense]
MSIQTAGDASAYLSISSTNTDVANAVVDDSGGQIVLRFDNTASSQSGVNGLNTDAQTTFTNILKIRNSGTSGVEFGVDASEFRNIGGITDFNVFAHNTPSEESPEYDSANFLNVDSSYPAAIQDPGPGQDHVNLSVGEEVLLSFQINTDDSGGVDINRDLHLVAVKKGGRYDLGQNEQYP